MSRGCPAAEFESDIKSSRLEALANNRFSEPLPGRPRLLEDSRMKSRIPRLRCRIARIVTARYIQPAFPSVWLERANSSSSELLGNRRRRRGPRPEKLRHSCRFLPPADSSRDALKFPRRCRLEIFFNDRSPRIVLTARFLTWTIGCSFRRSRQRGLSIECTGWREKIRVKKNQP